MTSLSVSMRVKVMG